MVPDPVGIGRMRPMFISSARSNHHSREELKWSIMCWNLLAYKASKSSREVCHTKTRHQCSGSRPVYEQLIFSEWHARSTFGTTETTGTSDSAVSDGGWTGRWPSPNATMDCQDFMHVVQERGEWENVPVAPAHPKNSSTLLCSVRAIEQG